MQLIKNQIYFQKAFVKHFFPSVLALYFQGLLPYLFHGFLNHIYANRRLPLLSLLCRFTAYLNLVNHLRS